MSKLDLKSKLRLGFLVLGILILIEVVEFVVGVGLKGGAWPYLGILALIGAWPILHYFMHITHLWRRE